MVSRFDVLFVLVLCVISVSSSFSRRIFVMNILLGRGVKNGFLV